MDGGFEAGSQGGEVEVPPSDRRKVAPCRIVVTPGLVEAARQVVARGEILDVPAVPDQRLHLRGDIQVSVLVAAGVEGNDADRIAGNEKVVGPLVVEGEPEGPAELVEEVGPVALVDRD